MRLLPSFSSNSLATIQVSIKDETPISPLVSFCAAEETRLVKKPVIPLDFKWSIMRVNIDSISSWFPCPIRLVSGSMTTACGLKSAMILYHYCPGDDFFIPRSRLMARYLALDLRFFDLNCFSPELASGRLLGTRRRLPTMRDESWPNGFFPGRRSSSTL